MAEILPPLPPLFDKEEVRERLTRIEGVPAKLTTAMLYRAHQAMKTGLVPSDRRMTWDRFIRYSVAYRYRTFLEYLADIEAGHPLFGIKAVFDVHGYSYVDGRWCVKLGSHAGRRRTLFPASHPKLFADEAAMAEYVRLPSPLEVSFPMRNRDEEDEAFLPPFRTAAALDDAIEFVASLVRIRLLDEICALLAPMATHGLSDRTRVRAELWKVLEVIPAVALLVEGATYPDAITRQIRQVVAKGLTFIEAMLDTSIPAEIPPKVEEKSVKVEPPRRAWFPPPPDRATRGIVAAPMAILPKAEPKPESKPESKPEVKPEAESEVRPESESKEKPEEKPEPKIEIRSPFQPRLPVPRPLTPPPLKEAWDLIVDAIALVLPRATDLVNNLSSEELERVANDVRLNSLLRDIARTVLQLRQP
jgi:hypothetical protein